MILPRCFYYLLLNMRMDHVTFLLLLARPSVRARTTEERLRWFEMVIKYYSWWRSAELLFCFSCCAGILKKTDELGFNMFNDSKTKIKISNAQTQSGRSLLLKNPIKMSMFLYYYWHKNSWSSCIYFFAICQNFKYNLK